MKRPLDGRVAIITGSGQGIGRDIALCLAQEGAAVITNNRKPGSSLNAFEKTDIPFTDTERAALEAISGDARTTADEINRCGGRALPVFGDVSDFDTARSLVDAAKDTFGRIDIVVHNASSNWVGNIMDMDETLWDISINSKLKGAFNLMHHALPNMKEQGFGRILNSSSDSYLGVEGYAAYGAANAGIVALTKAAAADLRGLGITMNAYTPLARTRAWINAAAAYKLQGVPSEAVEAGAPEAMKHTAEGMVPFLAYLASDDASDISGHLFRLAADGEIGIWSTPEVFNSIHAEGGIWTMETLKKSVPNGLMRGVEAMQSSIPTH